MKKTKTTIFSFLVMTLFLSFSVKAVEAAEEDPLTKIFREHAEKQGLNQTPPADAHPSPPEATQPKKDPLASNNVGQIANIGKSNNIAASKTKKLSQSGPGEMILLFAFLLSAFGAYLYDKKL